MSEERKRDDSSTEQGPGYAYQTFVQMEEFLDKLKLLNYEASFCLQLGFKPFHRLFFALQTNSGEQFYAFTSICAWLLQMSGKHFEQPQESDDPNATISSILDEVRSFGYHPDFPPSKLKTGFGENCLWVLDQLADEALKAKNFTWKIPIYPQEQADEDQIIDDDAEMNLDLTDKEDKDSVTEIYDSDEENVMGLDDLKNINKTEDGGKPDEIMQSTTDANEWRLEVERVLPQLKVSSVRSEHKDWRYHVDAMHTHSAAIETVTSEAKGQLDKLYGDIGRTLEKISSREKYLNTQLEGSLSEMRSLSAVLMETKEKYKLGNGGVIDRSKILTQVSDDLERVKLAMDEKGMSMTDGQPLIKIKQAIAKMKDDICNMDTRIGVVQHILLQARIKEKSSKSNVTLE